MFIFQSSSYLLPRLLFISTLSSFLLRETPKRGHFNGILFFMGSWDSRRASVWRFTCKKPWFVQLTWSCSKERFRNQRRSISFTTTNKMQRTVMVSAKWCGLCFLGGPRMVWRWRLGFLTDFIVHHKRTVFGGAGIIPFSGTMGCSLQIR